MEIKNIPKPKQHIVFADYGKVPPQNIEYEELLLSILITMNDYISYVSYFLKTHHFYKESNQLIYEIILQQHAKNFPFGTVEIATVARETNVLENIGGVVYINKIAQLSLNAKSSQLQYYAMHLIEKYILRSFIQINHKSTQDSYNNVDPFTIAEYVQKETTKLFSEVEILRMKELKKSFNSTIDSIIDNHTNENKTTKLFYSTGMPLIDEIALFRPNNCMILAGKSGSGKCFKKGTKVLMYDGSIKNIEYILIGDKVMGPDSKPRTVINTGYGVQQMYNIHQKFGQTYTVNEDHILSLHVTSNYRIKNGKRSIAYKDEVEGVPVNISILDYLAKNNTWKRKHWGYKAGVNWEYRHVEIDPYVLGVWLGDGSSRDIEVTNSDNEIIDYLQYYCNENDLLLNKIITKDRATKYTITAKQSYKGCNKLRNALKNYGILGLGKKDIPKDYLINDYATRIQLLAGLLDTDGNIKYSSKESNKIYNIHSRCPSYEITQKRKELADNIVFLASSLGFQTKLSKKIVNLKNISGKDEDRTYWRITIRGDVHRIPCKVKRKIAPKIISTHNPLYTPIYVEKADIDEYYGIDIDGDRLFMLDDFTVVHNTRLLISLMRILLLKHDDISVRWYSMEDDMSKLIKCILSPIVGLTDNQLSGINYTMTTEEINKLKEYQNAFSKLDVEIIENSRSISQIAIEYKTFVNDRKDKMNFLIIDNLMLLNENSYVGGKLEVDDTITKELINLRKYCNDNNINSYIIAIHHFNDEQIKKENLKTAYRPIESNIKGSSRFRDAFTQVVLLNAINNYPDLLEEFPEEKEILEDLYIFDLTKYRDGSKAIIRFFGNPEYSEFVYANGNVYGKSNSKKFKKKK